MRYLFVSPWHICPYVFVTVAPRILHICPYVSKYLPQWNYTFAPMFHNSRPFFLKSLFKIFVLFFGNIKFFYMIQYLVFVEFPTWEKCFLQTLQLCFHLYCHVTSHDVLWISCLRTIVSCMQSISVFPHIYQKSFFFLTFHNF